MTERLDCVVVGAGVVGLAVARSLANDPKVLLADEPTGNLDSKTAGEIMEMILELHAKGDRTIILVTHDQESAEKYAERLIIMEDGKVKEDRPPISVVKAKKPNAKKKEEKAPEPEKEEPKTAVIPNAEALARLEGELQRLKDALAAANASEAEAEAEADVEDAS